MGESLQNTNTQSQVSLVKESDSENKDDGDEEIDVVNSSQGSKRLANTPEKGDKSRRKKKTLIVVPSERSLQLRTSNKEAQKWLFVSLNLCVQLWG